MKIGKTIRKLRELEGYSQEYMAIQLDVSQKTYSRIENDSTKINLLRLEQIATSLNLEILYLLILIIDTDSDYSPKSDSSYMNVPYLIDDYFEKQIKPIVLQALSMKNILYKTMN